MSSYWVDLPTVMWGHFLRPACSMKVRVLIEIPMPHVAEQGDQSAHFVVRQTPTPSPASSVLAALFARLSSSSSSSLTWEPLQQIFP